MNKKNIFNFFITSFSIPLWTKAKLKTSSTEEFHFLYFNFVFIQKKSNKSDEKDWKLFKDVLILILLNQNDYRKWNRIIQ